ncbi:hypothetical protein SK128_005795 [Halocaridina rubra]|uniref:Myb/SANT-like DNA-binding domain-containing protein n=1 Tax=Halocaridina rubra TaxID=373956 RepID=A0AAN8ZW75_HALRR
MAGTSKDEEDTYSSVIIVHEDGDTHMSAEEEDGGGAIKDEEKALEHFVCEDSDDHFNYEATKLLIDGMQSRYTRMASAHRRPLVYQEIAEELMRYGYNMSSQDIKKKWCKIVSYFWSLRNRPDSQNWEFFEQLSTFLEIEDQALEAADDNFDRDSILALIECVRKRHDIFSQTSLHDRHALYSDISKEMKANGHCFSAVKIKRKWNYLLSKYKQEKEKEWVTEMWDYFEPMNDFIDPGSHGPALKGTGDKGEELQPPLSFGKASGSPTDISSTYNESSTKRATPLDSETSSHSLASTSGISKRFKLMDDYFTFLKERENEDRNYKKRKEKRSRMKLKMLGKIGTQLEAIAETQTEILREQNMILRSLKDILEAGK